MRPVWATLPGWSEDISRCRRFDDLPDAARRYVAFVERESGVPVRYIGTGPGRDEIIVR